VTIKQAVDIALERQPAIRAAKADLSGALVQRDAAYALTSSLGGPQIHVRRKQADLGVSLANAGVERATLDTIHAVSRTYVTTVFASEQVTVAKEAHDRLKVMYNTAKRLVDIGSKEITANDLDRIQTYMLLAETKVNEAQVGIARAKAALREAIGLEWDASLELADTDLNSYVELVQRYMKDHNALLSCEKAVRVALGNRADYQQAQLFAEIVCLEIDAQKLTVQPYARTFAATADIHAPVLPATVIDGDYRPGPVGPEMPVYLAGSCSARTERASLLHERALAVVEKAGGLIALQVTEACERLHQEAKQVELLRQASKQATKARERSEEAYRNDQLKTDVMLTAQVIDSQTKAQLNEALYRHAVALAALQNATSGQIWESFETEGKKAPAVGK
jgi:outer membrane protein TolC